MKMICCAKKGIKREFSVARTPQQNGVVESKNRTLIEAARTMLADSLLPIPFWAEAVNTACYVLNRVLVIKPQNKTPYELLIGKTPSISFMRPFGCPLTILNTLDSLSKFDGKSDEGYLLGYSTSSKAFRVYNKRTKRVEENLHMNFLEDQPNVAGTGPNWIFDLDFLTNSMNYVPISVENQVNVDAGTQDSYVAEKPSENASPDKDIQDSKDVIDKEGQHQMPEDEQVLQDELEMMVTQELVANAINDISRQAFEEEKRRVASQKKAAQTTSTNQLSTDKPFVSTDRSFVSTDRSNTPNVSAASTPTGANVGESLFVYIGGKIPIDASTLPNADLPIGSQICLTWKIFLIIFNDGIVQLEHMNDDEDEILHHQFKKREDSKGFFSTTSLEEPKTISQALKDESWVEAMQEELLQFKLQTVWVLVDLPYRKKVIGTKWVFRNKRDERSIVVKNKARLVAQGFRLEEGIDYDEFWTTAKSRTVNNTSYIDATVAGKPVTISEASIRSDLLFDDADGIDSLTNQAIFDNIKLMGYEGDLNTLTFNKALFSPQWKFFFHTMNHWKVTPLFDFMLVQQIEDEGDASERPSDSPPIPSPPHPSEDQPQIQPDPSPRPSPTTHIIDFILEGSGGNHRGQSSNDTSLSGNEDGLTLQSVYDLCVSLCKQVTAQAKEIKDLKAQGRKFVKTFKGKPSVHKDPAFDDLDNFMDVDDTLDYMETEDVQEERRNEGTDKGNEGTDKQDGGTDSSKVSTDRQGEGTADQNEGKSATQTAPTPTPIVFGDDETIAQVLIIMSQNKEKLKKNEKGVEIRNVEETERPRPTSTRSILTLRPLPKIDLKDKGKKRIEEEDESDTESEGITEAEKKFKQLANDEEVARKVQEEWEAEEEKKRLAEEEATKAALSNEYDFIQARLNADKILAEELQKEEREKFTIEQRAKFLHDTIAAQRKFLAQQRSEAIRNKPPTRNQLRNQMMTYLKHVGGKKHSELKTKTFEEIQVLYERLKRQDQNFVAIGSAKDERQIKELNKDPEKKKRVVNETSRKEDTTKVPAEQEVTEKGTKKRKSGHVKMIARKRPRPQPDDDSDDEHRKCLRTITFECTIDCEIMETKLFIARVHKVSSLDGNYLFVYSVNGHFRAFNYLMEIMMESSTEENDQGDFWNNQQEWEIVRWRLYEACGVYILKLKDRTIIYMLVERRYPLSKELLQQMIDLGLEVEEESTATLQLNELSGIVHRVFLAFTVVKKKVSLVQQICLYMHDPREQHLAALKRILRYVQGTLDLGLHLYASSTTSLVGYTDADWASCPSTRSTEAEYRGVANVVVETAWLRNLLRELHSPLSTANSFLLEDNCQKPHRSAPCSPLVDVES
ncbi:putative ribonuclease H-like domain-containing protein [Tanacetum coccineum]